MRDLYITLRDGGSELYRDVWTVTTDLKQLFVTRSDRMVFTLENKDIEEFTIVYHEEG